MRTATTTAPAASPAPTRTAGRRGAGRIVAGSVIAGFVTAAVLAASIGTRENTLTGAVLIGFALGWAMLAVLSTRRSTQPQRWAYLPAIFMAVGGVVAFAASDGVHRVLDWVWPPALFALVFWCVVRARRGPRWALYPVLAALLVASVAGGYQTVRAAQDERAHPMAGQLIDVGGYRLHLRCTGSGSPTVVLEPGLGEISSVFGWIEPAVARDTRVCVYDRAGRGWSDSAPGPQDGVQIATALHTLLRNAHVPGPYVLAGHSFGGLYVLAFADRYPDQIAGLVLLDSTAPKAAAPHGAGPNGIMSRASALVTLLGRMGGARLTCFSGYESLPPRARDEERAACSTARQGGSMVDEAGEAPTAMAQAAAVTDLAGKPLAVVTAGRNHDDAWFSAQNHLAALSTNHTHRVVPDATHASLLEAEADAAAATQAIRDVVTSVRTHRPLR